MKIKTMRIYQACNNNAAMDMFNRKLQLALTSVPEVLYYPE